MTIFRHFIVLMLLLSGSVVYAEIDPMKRPRDNIGNVEVDGNYRIWFDGDRERRLWLSTSLIAVIPDRQSVPSRKKLVDLIRTEFPEMEISQVNEAFAILQSPQPLDKDELTSLLSLHQNVSGIKKISSVFVGSPQGTGHSFVDTGDIVVHFKRPLDLADAEQWAADRQITLVKSLGKHNAFLFSCSPASDCIAQANSAYHDDAVRFAYPNWIRPRQTRQIFTADADLSVSQTASPDPVDTNADLTYTIQIRNRGPGLARNVHLSDSLPSGVTLKSITQTIGITCSGTDVIDCNLGFLFSGQNRVISIVVVPVQAGEISNTVNVTSSVNDPNPSNNSSVLSTTVNEGGGNHSSDWNDPLFPEQWHLVNTGQGGGLPQADINVAPVWQDGITGAGVQAAIVDDGLEIRHEDLADKIRPNLSWDYVGNDGDPTAGFHGTSVAGILGASTNNGIGVVGAAPGTELVGLRLLGASNDTNEADALSYRHDIIDLSNNSWGPPDDGQGLFGPGPLAEAALAEGAAQGRSGKGTIYCWAGGNGGNNDNSNYDGYANSRYTIAVGASTNLGTRASYSEKGANLLVNTPSSGGTLPITTTDRTGPQGLDNGEYTDSFGGTSAATPLACGAIGLLLEANPALGWRDVQTLLAATATQNDPQDPDWTHNGAGYPVNHKYGFGRIDIAAAVDAARSWTMLGPEKTVSASANPNLAIPDNNTTGVSSSVDINDELTIESVEIVFNAEDHPYWGDLDIRLVSPAGTESVLAEKHNSGAATSFYNNWRFSSMRYLGESATGTWTLRVSDRAAADVGTFNSWSLIIHGTGQASPSTEADLTVTMNATPDPVTVGEILNYHIEVSNNGPAAATVVTLTDTLPQQVTVSSINSSQGSCNNFRPVTCTFDSLANGAHATVDIKVTPTAAGIISNTVSVNANEHDPNGHDNTATTETQVETNHAISHSLTVRVLGNGKVISEPAGIDCPNDCTENYPESSSITLTAIPQGTAKRVIWSGACRGFEPVCHIDLNSDRTATAWFL